MSTFSTTLFLFTDTATTEIYTLSLHDALPISSDRARTAARSGPGRRPGRSRSPRATGAARSRRDDRRRRSRRPAEIGEHTSELQSQSNLVCRLLLEKKNKNK